MQTGGGLVEKKKKGATPTAHLLPCRSRIKISGYALAWGSWNLKAIGKSDMGRGRLRKDGGN